jgi:predicted nucleic acid-binding protein
MSAVYDAGALIAADRSDRAVWAEHRARLELGLAPVTTAPVVAQASRSPRQAQLRRFLRGCAIVSFSDADAHEVGALAGKAKASDVVDVHVVVVAHRRGFGVVTSDKSDLRPVVAALGRRVPLFSA